MKYCTVCLSKIEECTGNRKGKSEGNIENYKGKKCESGRWGKGKGKNRGAHVRFTELENDCPGNTAISTDQTEIVSDEIERIPPIEMVISKRLYDKLIG